MTFGPTAAGAPTVSPAFVGLSIELYNALPMLGAAAAPRRAMAQALLNFADMTPGPHEGPVLRLGGNSADSACWHAAAGLPAPPPPQGDHPGYRGGGGDLCACGYNVTGADLAAYRAFAALTPRLNASFVLGGNLACGDAPRSAALAAAVTRARLWGLVRLVEASNKVDKFPGGGKRPAGWGYAAYEAEVAAHVTAYRAAGLPAGRRLQAAVFCDFQPAFDGGVLNGSLAAGPLGAALGALSYHAYSLHGGSRAMLPPQWPAPSSSASTRYHRAALLSAAPPRAAPRSTRPSSPRCSRHRAPPAAGASRS